jgi:RNA polymerase sigma-70 factor (ECF subfamily)
MPSNETRADSSPFADDASRATFELFTRRLIALARNHLHVRLQRKVDPEDVVQSAYKSFFLRYGEEAIATEPPDNLWALLSVITLRKCADRVRHFATGRRNLAREAENPSSDGVETWRQAIDREPTPEQAAVLAEIVEQLLAELTPPERPIVELSLQGYSTREVSEQLGRAERSVRRVRERVKQRLEQA